MFTVYLGGYMNDECLEECLDWRLKVRTHYLQKSWDMKFICPFNKKELESIKDQGNISSIPKAALVDRDYQGILASNLIIANLNTFGCNRPPLGTICEITWAYDMKKPIIVISKEDNIINHPFIQKFASWIVPNEDSLLKERAVNYFYSGVSSAKYTREDVEEELKRRNK